MSEPENGQGVGGGGGGRGQDHGAGGGGEPHEPLFLRFGVPKDWRTKDSGVG